MSSSQIVTENQLDEWVRANARDAQGTIVELIWRLVCASCPQPIHRRFPLPDSIGQHGADADLEADPGFLPYIPEGKSHWEIGCSLNARNKANSDYADSTATVPEHVRKETAFVFVTPLSGRRDWRDTWKPDGIETWLEEKRALKEWKDVRVLDGTQIVDWVSQFPAIGHWLARLVVGMPDDFETAESRWNECAQTGAPPPLLPDLFLASREQSVEKLRQVLVERTSNQLRLDTHYPADVADFVSACIATYPDEERAEQLGRILILPNPDSWKRACTLSSPHTLVADFDLDASAGHKLIQRALSQRHAVIYRGSPGGPLHGNAASLSRPRVHQMQEALTKSGYSTERARTVTNLAGHDLSALLRLLQGLSAMPGWATQSEAADLAIAQLVAGWDENCKGDVEVIEALAGKEFREWITSIRKVHGAQPAPLDYFDGRWKFTSRFEPWHYLGSQIGGETLDTFGRLSVTVLSEPDPALELPKDARFAAAIHGKVRRYSSGIRRGMAETVALLGARGDALTACPTGKSQEVARQVVVELLGNADSIRWASLTDVLPLLAEASPDAFLQAVGGASEYPENPFSGVFAEEGGGFPGQTYISGLLWGLESLAWSPIYLGRVCRILANLAAIDPGGQWTNRPNNSLVTILLPWFPQTCADKDQRHRAVEGVIREQPEVGWRIILGLLPEIHGSTSSTHKPKWQDWIHEDWRDGASVRQRLEDEGFYADIALEMAGTDADRLVELLDYYFRLRPEFRKAYRARLDSPEIAGLPDENRLKVWSSLSTKIQNHRKYADGPAWRVPEKALAELEEVANKLAPTDPGVHHRRLFSGHDFDLYEETGDWEAERKKLQQKRIAAIREILEQGGFEAVESFATSVEAPGDVGSAYAADTEHADDSLVLPRMLTSEEEKIRRFGTSYVWMKFRNGGWKWVDQVNREGWSTAALATFYSVLPFVSETWEQVTNDMGENQEAYWTSTGVFPEQDQLVNIGHALGKLLEYNRPDSVIECLRFGNLKGPEYSEFGMQALEALRQEHRIDQHAICELFNELHEDGSLDEDRVAGLEIVFLELLGPYSGSRPFTLHRRLAEQPDFFCEVIRMIYRSMNDPKQGENVADEEAIDKSETDEEQANKAAAARKGYALLQNWNYPPGLQRDGSYDAERLNFWVRAVENICSESGHWEVAAIQIGEVLFYAPRTEGGLWQDCVCAVLDRKDCDQFRRGLTMQVFNSRGVHGFTGGKEELELAEHWEGIAAMAESKGFPRLGDALLRLGKSYREDAKRTVLEHEHDFD